VPIDSTNASFAKVVPAQTTMKHSPPKSRSKFLSLREGLRHPKKYFKQFAAQPGGYLKNLIRQPRRAILGERPSSASRKPAKKSFLDHTIPKTIFDDHPVEFYETDTGNYYLPCFLEDDIVANTIKKGRIFEPEVIAVAEEYIKTGTVVLDVGANYGQMSLFFSNFTGPDGVVVSFEAQKYCHAILQKNITANGKENIRAIYAGVFDETRKYVIFPEPDFQRFPSYGAYPVDLNASNGNRVDTITIDDLKIDRPISFLKVDIQGSDLYALRGARQTILRHRMPILFEFEQQFQEEFGTSFQDYVDFVKSIGYRFSKVVLGINYLILPEEGRVPEKAQDNAPVEERKDIFVVPAPPFRSHLNKFLKNMEEVYECTSFLHRYGYVSHNLTCKDWDLAHIIPEIGDGNVLDMGSSDSYILKNVSLKKRNGKLYGIDLNDPDVPLRDVTYLKGDLMNVGLPDSHLHYITCLSVIEHQVDFALFAREVNRLLVAGGRLFVTYDYWNPLLSIPIKAYGLNWQPLDRPLVESLIEKCHAENLHLTESVDWNVKDQVIRWGYYSPHPDVAYTFGMLVFQKTA
jgi:FkbM family methyltransferase